MAVKLHRCSNVWVKIGGHPCWRVQRELDAAGIDYEVVKHSVFRREEALKATGQKKYPWIEFEDGSVLREESADLAARVKSGRLFEGRDGGAPSGGEAKVEDAAQPGGDAQPEGAAQPAGEPQPGGETSPGGGEPPAQSGG